MARGGCLVEGSVGRGIERVYVYKVRRRAQDVHNIAVAASNRQVEGCMPCMHPAGFDAQSHEMRKNGNSTSKRTRKLQRCNL